MHLYVRMTLKIDVRMTDLIPYICIYFIHLSVHDPYCMQQYICDPVMVMMGLLVLLLLLILPHLIG